jgi:hypothetical protein
VACKSLLGFKEGDMRNSETDNLAVLIDADNAQASVIQELLGEVAQYGMATIKRAYGDWTTPNLSSWKDMLNMHAIQPIQQFAYTNGKNATDSALIIDAMDLLHGGKVDGFCLVSSDSDFTRLATRIRESGLVVYGFGEKKTPQAFVSACNKFIYTEILRKPSEDGPPVVVAQDQKLKTMLQSAVSSGAQEDGWANLGTVGQLLSKQDSSFDARNYGFKKLSDLIKSQSYLEIKSEKVSKESQNIRFYVRTKET